MSPSLMLVYSPDTHKMSSVIDASKGPVVVGRQVDDDAGVSVHDDTLSRNHFKVFCVNEVLFIEDLKSTNGIMIDGQMYHGSQHQMVPGMAIRAGGSIWVCVCHPERLDDGFFIYGSEEWVGHSAGLEMFRVRLEALSTDAPVWLSSNGCKASVLKVARALARVRGCSVQVEGPPTQEEILWLTSLQSVGSHHKNTLVAAPSGSECPDGFQLVEIPAFKDRKEDRVFWFIELARTMGVELLWGAPEVPYSLIMADYDDPSHFERFSRALLSGLREMEVLEGTHLVPFEVPLYTYRAVPTSAQPASSNKRPTEEVLMEALALYKGSIRATAKNFDVQRTQVYRWMRHYSIDPDQFRER
jgi:hypothetical protein